MLTCPVGTAETTGAAEPASCWLALSSAIASAITPLLMSTTPATSRVSTSSRRRLASVISARKSRSTVVSVSAPSDMSYVGRQLTPPIRYSREMSRSSVVVPLSHAIAGGPVRRSIR